MGKAWICLESKFKQKVDMGWLIDVTTIPSKYTLKDVINMIKAKEFDKLKENEILYQKVENQTVDNRNFDSITCTCYGIDRPEDCSC